MALRWTAATPRRPANIYTEDTHIDIDGVAFMDGREQARGIVTSPAHQGIMPNCAHVMGPFVIQLDGKKATATGYATVYVKEDGQVRVWRQSYGRWTLRKDSRMESGGCGAHLAQHRPGRLPGGAERRALRPQ